MATLAIKGHATRGREVIELLEMLGGRIMYAYNGDDDNAVYFIDGLYIMAYKYEDIDCKYTIFTLEDFLAKYPYKVGDKVLLSIGGISTIKSMYWSSEDNSISYKVNGIDDYVFHVSALQPYKEEKDFGECIEETIQECLYGKKEGTMEEHINYCQMGKITSVCFQDTNYEDKVELQLGNDYEIKEENGKYYAVKKISQYPKTYVECAKILNCFGATHIDGYKSELLEKFQELLICRDAYWKIAGDWRPEYEVGVVNTYYTIHTFNNKLFRAGTSHRNAILSFPTEEMRDAFYENFKDLIEQCKELL